MNERERGRKRKREREQERERKREYHDVGRDRKSVLHRDMAITM